MNDAKYDNYILTFNYTKFDDHKIIKSVLSGIDHITHWCMCDEIDKSTGNYHTHLFIMFSDPVPVSYVMKIFPAARIEPGKYDYMACISYVQKSGRFAVLKDDEFHLSDTFEDIYNPLKEEPEEESETLPEEEPETSEDVLSRKVDFLLCLIESVIVGILILMIMLIK